MKDSRIEQLVIMPVVHTDFVKGLGGKLISYFVLL